MKAMNGALLVSVLLVASCAADKPDLDVASSEAEHDGAEMIPVAQNSHKDILELTKKLSLDWNNGDMKAYLAAYWQDKELVIAFGDQVVVGAEAMTELFTSGWPDEQAMGDFEVVDITVRPIGPAVAISKGVFEHQYTDKKIVGAFTHVWQQFDGSGWKIIHEHTSGNPVKQD